MKHKLWILNISSDIIYRSHTNAWGKQMQLCHKKVKHQRGPIILAILVDLLSTMICAKIRPQGLFGSGEEEFWSFFTIYGHGYHLGKWTVTIFSNHLFSYPKEAPHDIRAALASEEKLFEILNIFSIQMWGQYECIGKQTWPHHKKVKCQCMTIIFATLVDLPSPKIWANIQPQGTLVLEKKIF